MKKEKILIALLSIAAIGAVAYTIRDVTAPSLEEVSRAKAEQISWEDARSIIMNGEAKLVVQSHNLDVRIAHEDGTVYIAKEPEIDDVFQVLERCGAPCDATAVATE